jgi:hypothetical protein
MALKVRLLMRVEMCVPISMTRDEQAAMNLCAWHDREFLEYSNSGGHVVRPISILSVRWLKWKEESG